MRVRGPPEHHDCPQKRDPHLRPVLKILKPSCQLKHDVAVHVGLVQEIACSCLVAVGLEKAPFARVPCKPSEVGEEPGIVKHQVVFDEAVVIVVTKPIAEYRLALKAEELWFGSGGIVLVEPVG